MAVALQRDGVGYTILERAGDLGGTWRDNTYPGCRCDVPSHLYSFSFAPNPDWSATYSPQQEIWEYLRRVAKEFAVDAHIRFGHELVDAAWDSKRQRWTLTTSAGSLTADFLVAGNGPLAEPRMPELSGVDTFAGTLFHSARWRWDHELAGRRVAVVGTGASAVQFVPEIRKSAAHVTVFQRTPGWVLPHPGRPIRDAERAVYRRLPAVQRLVRTYAYWWRELLVGRAMVTNRPSLERIERLATRLLHRQVADPKLRAVLTPTFTPGCKRLLPSNDWYPALQQSNVTLVPSGAVAVTPTGVVAADGTEHTADTIVFGTGFHVTDNPIADHIRGADGRTLAERWETTGPRAYLGTCVPGFPNLFLIAGPNTGIGHTSLLVMIEAQIRYVRDAIAVIGARRATSAEVRDDVYRSWGDEIESRSAASVWTTGGCHSWYLDADGRNSAIWPDLTYRFVFRTRKFDVDRYLVCGPA